LGAWEPSATSTSNRRPTLVLAHEIVSTRYIHLDEKNLVSGFETNNDIAIKMSKPSRIMLNKKLSLKILCFLCKIKPIVEEK